MDRIPRDRLDGSACGDADAMRPVVGRNRALVGLLAEAGR